MANTVKLADYLFTRLKQLGVGAIHGVPGDYNLTLLDYVEPQGLLWVGNANELNAGYAADGYARIKGVGALITTYGVGELSAINAIAGAFTERAAIVNIVGTPPRNTQESRLNVHHTLGDGEYGHFRQMYTAVSAAQTDLRDPRTCPQQIDEALTQCLVHSRPVYIQVPVDMVSVPVLADRLNTKIQVPEPVPNPANDEAVSKVLELVHAAKQPVIFVDGESRGLGLVDGVQRLITKTGWPTFTTMFGAGLVDGSAPNVHGIYRGSWADPKTKTLVDGADLILCFGPHFSTTNSYGGTSIPPTEKTIAFTHGGIKIHSQLFRDVTPAHTLSGVLQGFDLSKMSVKAIDSDLPRDSVVPFSEVSSTDLIKQDKVWRLLANYLREGDIVFGETGTAAYGVREMPLPPHTRVFGAVTWLSIGYMLPASQGAALAQRELVTSSNYHGLSQGRTILLIGDGSFQMTAQELGTIVHHNLNLVIFLINNDGYTIERCIHGVDQKYNGVAPWRYLQALNFFGAPENAHTASARTYGELQTALEDDRLVNGTGPRMVEVFMDRNDAPVGPLLDLLQKQSKTR